MELLLIGYIEEWSYWSDYIGAFERGIRENRDQNLDLVICSEGGSVLKGLQLSTLIQSHTGSTRAICYGFTASIATVIASSADKLVMEKRATWLVHPASGGGYGKAKELRQTADQIDSFTSQIMGYYLSRIGRNNKLVDGSIEKTKEMLMELMEEERVLTAQECLDLGLIDAIIEKETPRSITDNGGELVRQIETKYPDFTAKYPNFRNCYTKPTATKKSGIVASFVNGIKNLASSLGLNFKNTIEVEETQGNNEADTTDGTQNNNTADTTTKETATDQTTDNNQNTNNNNQNEPEMTNEEMIAKLKESGYNVEKTETPEDLSNSANKNTTDVVAEMQKQLAEMQNKIAEQEKQLKNAAFNASTKAAGTGEIDNAQDYAQQEREQRKNALLASVGSVLAPMFKK